MAAGTAPSGYKTTVARTEAVLEAPRPAWDALQGDVLMTDPVHYLAILREARKFEGPGCSCSSVTGRRWRWWSGGYRGVFRTGLTGYDPAFAEYNVGTFVLTRLLDDLARDDAFHVVDYGFGDAEYKHTFGTEGWQEADVLVFAPTIRGAWRNLGRTSVHGIDRSMRAVSGSMGARVKKAWRRRLQSQEGG